MNYKSEIQKKNIAWLLPRPKKDKYKGGMPLYAEEWLIKLACEILNGHQETWEIGSSKMNLLNVFCGMNKYGFRVDLNPEVKPDLISDIHYLSNDLGREHGYKIILADPPYSEQENKDLYGFGKLNYKKWTAECDKLLEKGGLFIIYHKYIMPNPNPKKYKIIKRVFIGTRTYHIHRVALFFKKN